MIKINCDIYISKYNLVEYDEIAYSSLVTFLIFEAIYINFIFI